MAAAYNIVVGDIMSFSQLRVRYELTPSLLTSFVPIYIISPGGSLCYALSSSSKGIQAPCCRETGDHVSGYFMYCFWGLCSPIPTSFGNSHIFPTQSSKWDRKTYPFGKLFEIDACLICKIPDCEKGGSFL